MRRQRRRTVGVLDRLQHHARSPTVAIVGPASACSPARSPAFAAHGDHLGQADRDRIHQPRSPPNPTAQSVLHAPAPPCRSRWTGRAVAIVEIDQSHAVRAVNHHRAGGGQGAAARPRPPPGSRWRTLLRSAPPPAAVQPARRPRQGRALRPPPYRCRRAVGRWRRPPAPVNLGLGMHRDDPRRRSHLARLRMTPCPGSAAWPRHRSLPRCSAATVVLHHASGSPAATCHP